MDENVERGNAQRRSKDHAVALFAFDGTDLSKLVEMNEITS